ASAAGEKSAADAGNQATDVARVGTGTLARPVHRNDGWRRGGPGAGTALDEGNRHAARIPRPSGDNGALNRHDVPASGAGIPSCGVAPTVSQPGPSNEST